MFTFFAEVKLAQEQSPLSLALHQFIQEIWWEKSGVNLPFICEDNGLAARLDAMPHQSANKRPGPPGKQQCFFDFVQFYCPVGINFNFFFNFTN